MTIVLGDLVVALSHALDFMEIDLLGGVTNHSKRVAYMALRLGQASGLKKEELSDLVALAILHDNGIGVAFQDAAAPRAAGQEARAKAESGPRHCLAGEENLAGFPFLTKVAGVLKCHHEQWDGSGFFGVSGRDIPWMARAIRLADAAELHARLDGIDYQGKRELLAWLAGRSGSAFDPELVEAFSDLSSSPSFWLDLQSEYVNSALLRLAPRFEREIGYASLRETTAIFSRIIDSKSRFTRQHSRELSERSGAMADRYGRSAEDRAKLMIAADLHDVGKLAVSNAILDKPGKLDQVELDSIQKHTYYTRVSLESIAGLEDVTEWAADHHEKLDGSGYPFGLDASRLDFESRLMACLDIYQALTELRPYREALGHERALAIMRDMAAAGKIDGDIVGDIDREFA